jgi:hypothetical protein
MKKIIALIITIVFIVFPAASSAFDQRSGDFRLEFEGDTWFDQSDLLAPNKTISKDFSVRNYSTNNQDLFFITKRSGQAGALDPFVKLSFYQEGSLVLEKGLNQISTNPRSQDHLGILGADRWTDYRVEATLADLDNDYQGKQSGEYQFILGFGGLGGVGGVPVEYLPVPGVGGETIESDQVATTGDLDEEPRSAAEEVFEDEPSVAGEEDETIETSFFASWYNWLLILLIFLILALIARRYWLALKKEEQEEEN